MQPPILLSVPNVSEGRDAATIAAVAQAFAGSSAAAAPGIEVAPAEAAERPARNTGVRLLDVHSDADHHRSVYTLAGAPVALEDALLRGASEVCERVDVVARAHEAPARRGQHPHVGALDVVPIVYLDESARGAACAIALTVADRIGEELSIPVFLYGELTADAGESTVTRAQLRRGGVEALARAMMAAPPLRPDFGPPRVHPRAGATLLAARPPLVAFNVQLAAPAGVERAREIAALIREGGEQGLPGVRAIGIALAGGVAQVSTNVERPLEVPLAAVVAAVARHAPLASAELVGLAPAAALDGFPDDLPMPSFDPARHVIENALGCL